MVLAVSKKGDYGLLLMAAMAARFIKDKKAYAPLKKIVKEKKLPYRFATQIATELAQAGLLQSKEGSGGGYRLNRSPRKISVADVLAVLEGPVAPVACFEKKCDCAKECTNQEMMRDLSKIVKTAMENYSLEDLI